MVRQLPVLLCCVLYVVSFALPALRFSDGTTLYGSQVFIDALCSMPFGQVIWLSNALFGAGVWKAFREKWNESLFFAVTNICFTAAQVVIYLPGWLADSHFLAGFYLWFTSFALLPTYPALQLRRMDPKTLFATGSLSVLGAIVTILLPRKKPRHVVGSLAVGAGISFLVFFVLA